MKIEPHTITIRDLVAGYRNDDEEGVVAYGGKLDVRPKYQREFIYSDDEQKAVIDTVTKGYPLNVMYWAVRGDGTYEVMDGQQRTLSLCEYVAGKFDYFFRYFGNLTTRRTSRMRSSTTGLRCISARAATTRSLNGSRRSTSQGRNSRTRNC